MGNFVPSDDQPKNQSKERHKSRSKFNPRFDQGMAPHQPRPDRSEQDRNLSPEDEVEIDQKQIDNLKRMFNHRVKT